MKMEPFVSGSSNLYLTNTRIFFYLLDQNIRNHFKCAFVFGFFFFNQKVSAPQVETRKYIKTFSYITQMKLTEIRFAVCFFVDLAKSNFKIMKLPLILYFVPAA